jgi:translation initiation factor eIF-2B subunit delta
MDTLRGQDTDEAAAAVKAQRDAKKAEKAARKMKTSKPTDDSVAEAAAPVQQDDLRGQDTDEAAAVVKAQRDAKKAEKAARKAKASQPSCEEDEHAATPSTAAIGDNVATAPAAAKTATTAPAVATAASQPSCSLEIPPSPSTPPAPVENMSHLGRRVVELGSLVRSQRIVGGNARCLALLGALQELIQTSPLLQDMHGMDTKAAEAINGLIQRNCDFVASCRDLSPGMTTSIKALKDRILRTADATHGMTLTPRDYVLRLLKHAMDDTVSAMFDVATKGRDSITENDVILTYGRSSAIESLLISERNHKTFSVIVVDAGPLYEGRGLVWRLQQHDIKTQYVLLTAVCATIPRCTKVFVGASSVLQSGGVLSRAGTALVALVAKRCSKPVLCFCETYKFSSKVWLGSLTNNQSAMRGLMYDLTPKELVDVVVSDIGLLHPSAIAAAIRDRDDSASKARVGAAVEQ